MTAAELKAESDRLRDVAFTMRKPAKAIAKDAGSSLGRVASWLAGELVLGKRELESLRLAWGDRAGAP